MLLLLSVSACAAGHGEDRIVASVGDHLISESELDAAWRERAPAEYVQAQQDAFRLRRQVLEQLVAEHLLRQQIDQSDLTAEELVARAIEDGVIPDIAPVDETAVVDLYAQSGAAEYGVSLGQLRPALIESLEEEGYARARERYIQLLRRDAQVRIRMPIPRVPVDVTRADPARGSPDAPVRLVEFSDFHCPFCRDLRPTLERLMATYGDDVQWVWKDYPAADLTAAAAARCAHDQGLFWEYHDGLFERQPETAEPWLDDSEPWLDDPAGVEPLLALAADIGLDGRQFADCVASGRYEEVVAEAAEAAYSLGVGGTPTVFINGRMVAGAQGFEAYEQIVLEELELLE